MAEELGKWEKIERKELTPPKNKNEIKWQVSYIRMK